MSLVRAARRRTIASIAVAASLLALALSAVPASAEPSLLPLDDVSPHRDATGRLLETVAVGLPDATLPTFESRCHSARARGEARARAAIARHVEGVVERAGGTPPLIVEARSVVDRTFAIVERRPLVDCGIVLRAHVPIDALDAVVQGLEVAW